LSQKSLPDIVAVTVTGSTPDLGFSSALAICGTSTASPASSWGVTTMKMMRRTRTTSTRGVTLISFLTPLAPPTAIAMTESLRAGLSG